MKKPELITWVATKVHPDAKDILGVEIGYLYDKAEFTCSWDSSVFFLTAWDTSTAGNFKQIGWFRTQKAAKDYANIYCAKIAYEDGASDRSKYAGSGNPRSPR